MVRVIAESCGAVAISLAQPRMEAREPPEKILARFSGFGRFSPRLGAVNRGQARKAEAKVTSSKRPSSKELPSCKFYRSKETPGRTGADNADPRNQEHSHKETKLTKEAGQPPHKASGRQEPRKHWMKCSFQGVRKVSARVLKVSGREIPRTSARLQRIAKLQVSTGRRTGKG